MSYPTKYTRQYDYVAYQNANPNRPLPAGKVNADLNAAQISSGQIVDFLKVAHGSTGALLNGSVTLDALSPTVLLGFSPPHPWTTLTLFTAGKSTVFYANKFYVAAVTHTSTMTFDASKWTELVSFDSINSVSYTVEQALTNVQQSLARRNINAQRVGALDIRDYGGVGDDTTLCDQALLDAFAAFPASGCGAIYFPAGTYKFASVKTLDLVYLTGNIAIFGDGPRTSELHFPNTSGGLVINQGNFRPCVNIHDLSFTTGKANAANGLSLLSAFSIIPTSGWSELRNLLFSGDDWKTSYGYINGWAKAIHVKVWSQINYINVNTTDKDTSGGGGSGIGVHFEGDAASSLYTILHNFSQCSFTYHAIGAWYGDFVQGVTFNQCNFNGASGGSGIFTSGSVLGVLAQLGVFNSQFDVGGPSLNLNSGIYDVMLVGTTFTVSKNNAIALYIPQSVGTNIIGCKCSSGGSPTNTFGVVLGGTGRAAILGCTFADLTVGINMQSGTTKIVALNNIMQSVSVEILDNGTGNITGLGVSSGGTGLSTVAQGDLLYASATDTMARLAKSATASRYLANTGTSNNPAWDQVSLSDGVKNTLPVANGGTGQTSVSAFKTALTLVKGDVGLGNVDNTSDATKNAASATLANKTLTAPVINSPTGIVKGDVGLGNVDNTSDATKNAASATLTTKTIDTAANTFKINGTTVTTAADFQGALAAGALAFKLSAANFNSTADQAITLALPTGFTRYRIQSIIVSNPSISLTTAVGGIYTAAAKGGIAIVAASTAWSPLTNSTAGTSGSVFQPTVVNGATAFYNSTTLYLSLTTPQGAAATADVTIIIQPLP